MVYTVHYSSKFKKDLKLAKKQGKNIKLFEQVVELLSNGKPLPNKYKNHKLFGKWSNHYECHIEPDWLLIYYYQHNKLILVLSRIGSHSQLLE